jgi:hypothetical protein
MQVVNSNKVEAAAKARKNKKEFIVKSVFLGNKELKDIIWRIAENKTIREMAI